MKPVPVPASRPLTGKAMSLQESTRVMLPPSTSEHRSPKTVDEDATADGAGPGAANNDSADNRAGSNVEGAADAKAAAGGAITADAKITAEQGVDAAEATDSVPPRERPGTATGLTSSGPVRYTGFRGPVQPQKGGQAARRKNRAYLPVIRTRRVTNPTLSFWGLHAKRRRKRRTATLFDPSPQSIS